MDAAPSFDRRTLQTALRGRYPWIDSLDYGPRAVTAGECDRCGAEPRLFPTCGPQSVEAIGRRCALEMGATAWCEGHGDDARAALAWADRLPDEADEVTRLWWIATGEVALDPNYFATHPDIAEIVADALTLP